MNIPITKRWTLQFVWWGFTDMRMPFVWHWPRFMHSMYKGRPLFYGFGIGPIEFRWFDNYWGTK